MRRDVNDIQIQEPAIRELGKKRSCVKRSCFTGCGCGIFFLIGALLLVQFALQPRSKELKDIPANFPASIPLYDAEALHSISYTSAADRSEWVKKAAGVPRALLSPILAELEKQSTSTASVWAGAREWLENPITKEYDTLRVEWTGLTAQPAFVNEFYQSGLRKNGFTIEESANTDTIHQFAFKNGDTNGVLYIKDDPKKDGTDLVALTVNYSAQ